MNGELWSRDEVKMKEIARLEQENANLRGKDKIRSAWVKLMDAEIADLKQRLAEKDAELARLKKERDAALAQADTPTEGGTDGRGDVPTSVAVEDGENNTDSAGGRGDVRSEGCGRETVSSVCHEGKSTEDSKGIEVVSVSEQEGETDVAEDEGSRTDSETSRVEGSKKMEDAVRSAGDDVSDGDACGRQENILCSNGPDEILAVNDTKGLARYPGIEPTITTSGTGSSVTYISPVSDLEALLSRLGSQLLTLAGKKNAKERIRQLFAEKDAENASLKAELAATAAGQRNAMAVVMSLEGAVERLTQELDAALAQANKAEQETCLATFGRFFYEQRRTGKRSEGR